MPVYQLNVNGNCSGEYVQNTFHYDVVEAGGATIYQYTQDLIAAWETAVRTPWKNALSNAYFVSSLSAKKVQSPGGPLAVTVYTPGVQGGARGNTEASGIGACILWPVFLAGKNVTGRTFIPGVAQLDLQDNVFSVAYNTVLLTLIGALTPALTLAGTGTTAQLCIYHRQTQVNTHVAFGRVSTKVGTQRRRYVPIP